MQYFVLGPTQVRRTAEEPPEQLGGGRVRALLSVLAAEAGRPVPAERLIAEVWGEEPPADAPGALQALVGRLRRALGREAITSEPGGGYRLAAAPDSVDVHLFEQLTRDGERALAAGDPHSAAAHLTRALALWRGPAFADLPDRALRAARPEALHRTAQKLRFDAELALGHGPAILPDLREAVLAHPLDESFHAQLITALRAQGRTAEALLAYEEARTVLADTLGADPGPELRTLHAELLSEPAPAPPRHKQKPKPGNLRARLTSFVGREAEVRDIRRTVASTARLVTLTGPGGSGKTRLAQEAAEAAEATEPTVPTLPTGAAPEGTPFPDGIWLAELAPLDDPAALPQAVLSALGRRDAHVLGPGPLRAETHAEDPTARLLEHCARRRLLLVLDNCEHLIAAAATLTADLLAACPGVTVLATSREPLGVPGELVRPVEPLPPPTAYRLFADRAATVRPGPDPYPADGPDAAAVREICRRLDGLPLAIELAAARLRALTPRQIADRLDDRFRLLTSGSRTVLPRQQTLRAVVDWSWDLLAEPERTALCALSVFAGGCTLPAAEAVCGPDALEWVAQLVDKSLVVADLRLTGDAPGAGTEVRYRLLETIHEYAAERAAERPAELALAAGRHTAYYRDLVRTADGELRGPDQLYWLEVLETELDNVRAALHRAVEAGDESDGAGLALSMGWFWWLRNYRAEADSWLERVISLADPAPDDPADPLYWPRLDLRMLLFFVKSDHAAADQLSTPESRETAVVLERAYRGGGPAAARFPGLLWPFTSYVVGGGAEALFGGTEDMRWHTEEVVANCREYGDEWALAAALLFRTHTAVDSPDGLAVADASKAELEALTDRLGDRWIRAQMYSAAGEIAMARGDYAAARRDLEAAHRLGSELGADAESAFLLARLAEVAHRDGDDESAAELLARAEDAAEEYSVWDARTYVRYLTSVLLLRRGEVARAREVCDLATEHASDGTPPPIFRSLMTAQSARVTAAEGDARGALAEAELALRLALAAGASESVLGAQIDLAAEMLAACGEPEPAAVLLAAAHTIRTPLPRSRPEQEVADAVAAAAADALPAPVLAAARARGAGMAGPEVMALVDALTARITGSGSEGGSESEGAAGE